MINMQKWFFRIFYFLVSLSLLAPLIIFKSLQYPYVDSQAFFLRILIELAFPFYVYLILQNTSLRPNLKKPLNIALLVFLLINIISAFHGVNPHRSLWGNFERMTSVYFLGHLTLLSFYIQLLGQAGFIYVKRMKIILVGVATFESLNA